MRISIIVGTRPNFIKVTQFSRCAAAFPDLKIDLIHTGQHYDEKMADVFFRQFGLQPGFFLNVGAGSPVTQVAEIMMKLEELYSGIGTPDLLLVPGDVNSTLAGALFANKSGIRLGHIEAGLRSFDRTMPEEFNRVLTDEMSDIFFVTEPSGLSHLKTEGKAADKIHLVGNTMIDTMVAFEDEIDQSSVLSDLSLEEGRFVLMTMHRPATVDSKNGLEKLLHLLKSLTARYRVVFPVHPRTTRNMERFGIRDEFLANEGIVFTEPMDYFAFQKLVKTCAFVVTDSGGIQEETTFRRKPCITLRPNTERPVTVDIGTNTLMDFDVPEVMKVVTSIENGTYKKGSIPEMWDGRSTERIVRIIAGT